MPQPTTIHSTFVLERSFPQAPERVFAAFSDPARKRHWFAESHSHDVEKFELDFRVGGIERASYRFREGSPFPGVELSSEGAHLDIVPDRRIVMASSMSLGGRRISASLITFELLQSGEGTELICTHQGTFFEGSDGPQMREMGWRKILDQFAAELAR